MLKSSFRRRFEKEKEEKKRGEGLPGGLSAHPAPLPFSPPPSRARPNFLPMAHLASAQGAAHPCAWISPLSCFCGRRLGPLLLSLCSSAFFFPVS